VRRVSPPRPGLQLQLESHLQPPWQTATLHLSQAPSSRLPPVSQGLEPAWLLRSMAAASAATKTAPSASARRLMRAVPRSEPAACTCKQRSSAREVRQLSPDESTQECIKSLTVLASRARTRVVNEMSCMVSLVEGCIRLSESESESDHGRRVAASWSFLVRPRRSRPRFQLRREIVLGLPPAFFHVCMLLSVQIEQCKPAPRAKCSLVATVLARHGSDCVI
jgi:hypothetical protein